jgi:alpha-1,3-mannosyl-glycoprotein beta-1,2-N-acetylglucosaminyltransferase
MPSAATACHSMKVRDLLILLVLTAVLFVSGIFDISAGPSSEDLSGGNLRGRMNKELLHLKLEEVAELRGRLNMADPSNNANLDAWKQALKERDEIIVRMQVEEVQRGESILDLESKVKASKLGGGSAVAGSLGGGGASGGAGAAHPDPVILQDNPATANTANAAVPDASISDFARTTTLLIYTYKRADYLHRTLSTIKDLIPKGMSILISQDGNEREVNSKVDEFTGIFAKQGNELRHAKHTQKSGENGYQLLSQHYGFGLREVFQKSSPKEAKRVIILEEDIQVAVDFFKMFEALAPMLDDPRENLLCASAWNDNGMRGYVEDSKKLVRSDFFPGLGWMMTREVWEDLSPKWPRGYWDDWLREPVQRKGRDTIRPEVSRTFHFGQKGGTSNNVYSQYLDSIELNEEDVEWREQDLSYLRKDIYDGEFERRVEAAQLVTAEAVSRGIGGDSPLRVEYIGLTEGPSCFARIANKLGIMDNIKANVPRTAYFGIVEYKKKGKTIFVTPPLGEILWDRRQGG